MSKSLDKLRSFSGLLIICISCFALTACLSSTPKRIAFSNIKLVEVEKTKNFRFKAEHNLSSTGKLLFLKLDIVSELDIWKYANDESYILHIDSYFCDKPDYEVMIALNRLYWNNVNISKERYVSDSKIKPNSSGIITYSILLDLDSQFTLGYRYGSEKTDKSPHVYEPFDLINAAEDICIQIRGRTMLGGAKTNVVKVPKNFIQEELKRMNEFQSTLD